MGIDMQNIINEISENKIKVKKSIKNVEKTEKKQIKQLIFDEKLKKVNITSKELAIQFGVSIPEVELIFKELKEIQKKESDIKEKQVKEKAIKINKKSIFNKINEKIKKIFDKEDKSTLKGIFLKIALFGIPLNFSLLVIFGIKFNLYSWIGWGYAFWFIEKEALRMLRSLWFK